MHFPDLPYILTIDEDDYDLEPFWILNQNYNDNYEWLLGFP